MNVLLYGHGGSANHGCEALVRSTVGWMNEYSYSLLTKYISEDLQYGLDRLVSLIPVKEDPSIWRKYVCMLQMKMYRDDYFYYKYKYGKTIRELKDVHWALSIGGDNYCYRGLLERVSAMNHLLNRYAIPTALWGCSIDSHRMNNRLIEDLHTYRFITARESLTFQLLKDCGIKSVYCLPDTAFKLTKEAPDENVLSHGVDYVGINVSPLICRYEKVSGMVLENMENLIHYLLSETGFHVLLIPHVVSPSNDDRVPLHYLYKKYNNTHRVQLLDDQSAPVLKFYISKCRFLIAARTHAVIAGYSSAVPTLALGYSVKARGIARDVLGTDRNYVLPVDSFSGPTDLTNRFRWLLLQEDKIRQTYERRLDAYISRLDEVHHLFSRE